MFSAEFIRRGGWWVLGQALLLGLTLAGGLVWTGNWSGVGTMVAGLVLLAIAAAVGLAGTISLGRNLTPFPQPGSGSRLVQTGIYGRIRHPLYTAVFCAATGWAVLRGSGLALIAALALAPFFDAKARAEERALRRTFPEYSAYQKRVPRRFIPWVY